MSRSRHTSAKNQDKRRVDELQFPDEAYKLELCQHRLLDHTQRHTVTKANRAKMLAKMRLQYTENARDQSHVVKTPVFTA
jgi:hypothetical protein